MSRTVVRKVANDNACDDNARLGIFVKKSQFDSTGAMANPNPVTLPPSYVAKYNRFVDNILGRINKILRKNYDPVNVRLQTPPQTTDTKKKGVTTQKPKNKNKIESRER